MNTIESQSAENLGGGHRDERLLMDDLIRYLSRLATLNKGDKTGNPMLRDGLRQMVKAFQPHADLSVVEFADLVRGISERSGGSSGGREKVALPPNLDSLSQEDIEKILGDEGLTKSQIIEVGTRRFGIPRSKLAQSCKQDALVSIRAALDHEKSLEFISAEARRSGENRLS